MSRILGDPEAVARTASAGVTETLTAPPRRRWSDRMIVPWLGERLAGLVLMAITGAIVLIPVGYVFQRAFADDSSGIRRMLAEPHFNQALWTTVQLAVGGVVIAVVVGTALAWWSHNLPANRRWLGMLPLFPLVMPQLALLVGFAFLLSPRIGYLNQLLRLIPGLRGRDDGPIDIYTVPWIIIFTGLAYSPFVFVFVKSALARLHEDLIDAAAVSGASPTVTFWKVTIPLLRPALIYGSLTVALLAMGQFTAPLILGRQVGMRVLTTEMFYRTNTSPADPALASAYGLPIVIAGIAFLLLQRVLLRQQDRFVTTTGRGTRFTERRGRLGQSMIVLYGLLTVLAPLVALIIVSLQSFYSADIRIGDFNLDNYRTVLARSDLTESIKNSLLYALWTVVLVLPLGFAVARTVYHRRRKPIMANIQDLIASVPLGVPSVIFGAGFLMAFTVSPIRLYGTALGVVLVYVTIMLPFAARLILTSLSSLGDDLNNAAAVSGAGLVRRSLFIDLPLLRPALGSAMAIIVVLATHEFSASVLVRSSSTQIMGPVMYDLWTFGSYPLTAVMALIMCLVTGLGILLAMAVGGTGALNRLGGDN